MPSNLQPRLMLDTTDTIYEVSIAATPKLLSEPKWRLRSEPTEDCSLVLNREAATRLRGYRADARLNGAITFGMNAVVVRGFECVRLEHVRIVKSEHRRGYPGRNGLPAPCRSRRNCSLVNRPITCV